MIFSVESSDCLLGCKALSARSLSLLSVIVNLVEWSILFRRLKLFSPCINSEFRKILSLCHCQVLLFKRSFLLILYFPGGQCPAWNSQGGPLCLAWGREMQADVILKEPRPSWVPPLSLSGGGTRRGGKKPLWLYMIKVRYNWTKRTLLQEPLSLYLISLHGLQSQTNEETTVIILD